MRSTERKTSLRPAARLYTVIALALTLLALVLGALALYSSYDTGIGYYADGALPTLLTVVCIASVVFFAVFALLRFRGCASAYAKKAHLAVRITAALTAVLALLVAITDLRSGAPMLSLLLGLGACLYFLLIAAEKATPALSLAFGACVIFRILTEVTRSYTDLMIPMNSPEKLWLHLAAVAGMFFLISELRALISKPYTATLFFAAASATLLCAVAGGTLLAGSLADLFYGAPTKSETVFFALFLSLAIYAGARLCTIAPCPPEEAPEETSEEQTEESPEPEVTEATDND